MKWLSRLRRLLWRTKREKMDDDFARDYPDGEDHYGERQVIGRE